MNKEYIKFYIVWIIVILICTILYFVITVDTDTIATNEVVENRINIVAKTPHTNNPINENMPIKWVKRFENGTGGYELIDGTNGTYRRL